MTKPERVYDSGDLDAILDFERSAGYHLVEERIQAELIRRQSELEQPGSEPEFIRGQIRALRTALEIPGILRKEIKEWLQE